MGEKQEEKAVFLHKSMDAQSPGRRPLPKTPEPDSK